MLLPNNVLFCIQALNAQGFEAYAVGGCVRDSLLGLTPHDYDLCTSASPEQICKVFQEHDLLRNGEKHGTIGVILDQQVYEITSFRTEGGYSDGRHPDWVHFVTDLKQDLARRDFTVNAMAFHPSHGYIDPWGGQKDLADHILRAVGDPKTRFQEDALRILRGVRFSVRFGLTPEENTFRAMCDLTPTMDQLARERVFDELCKLLPLVNQQDLTQFSPVITQVIPELAPTVGFDQRSPHHIYDVFTHTAYVVAAVPPTLSLRWAALLHDIGKVPAFTTDETGRGHFYGHAGLSAQMANDLLLRLKAPNVLREQVVFLIKQHMTPLEPDRRLLRRRLSQYGEERVRQLLALQHADFSSKGTGTDEEEAVFFQIEVLLNTLCQEVSCLSLRTLAVSGNDLLEIGFAPGPAVGKCLSLLLSFVIDEQLPNEKAALLQAAETIRRNDI